MSMLFSDCPCNDVQLNLFMSFCGKRFFIFFMGGWRAYSEKEDNQLVIAPYCNNQFHWFIEFREMCALGDFFMLKGLLLEVAFPQAML